MTNEFRVQYKDSMGVWCNVHGTYSTYSHAIEKLVAEATSDPEYDHRVVRITEEVLGHVTGEGNINE